MPATQRGQAYRIATGKWGLRYYDRDGRRRRKTPFPSKSAALAYYRDVVEPQLLGDQPAMPDLTLTALVALYLERHAATVRPHHRHAPRTAGGRRASVRRRLAA